jgi:hypothetical protein
MYEVNRLNAKIDVGNYKEKKTAPIRKPIHLKYVINLIESQDGLDDYTKKKLVKMAGKRPHQALPMFVKNIRQYIIRISNERNKEIKAAEQNESKELEGSLLLSKEKEKTHDNKSTEKESGEEDTGKEASKEGESQG